MTTSKKNSFVSIAEQVQLLNNNSVEILTKINDVVSSQDSAVTVNVTNEDGTVSSYTLPTVGKLQSEINSINNNIKRLAGLNSNTAFVIDGNSTKKIFTSDLNREPNRIDSLTLVNQFTANNNWFFESLMNPMLSINFDLSNKVETDVDGVIARRYIVNFEKDEDGNYTTAGLKSKTTFNETFMNKTDINLKDFISWHTNTTNVGVVNNKKMVYDEQTFEFSYQDVSEYGIFSVLKQEQDTVNNKLWYHIYPYRYSTIDGEEKTIKKGDELILNSTDSVTRWAVQETSMSSNFRVRLERIEGYDPVPTGQNMLKFYGNPIVKKVASITIGFDEYNIIFVKPLNSKNKLKGSVWSKGTALYTNDLVLDSDNSVALTQYYLNNVYDYGMVIKDIVEKRIPSKHGVKPNKPVLLESNFKVTQINKHLTDTNSNSTLLDLHKTKTQLKTKLDQINSSITQKNKELALTSYTTTAQKNAAQNELSKLIQEQETTSKTLSSITTQIKSNIDSDSDASAKFRVRGFWLMPDAIKRSGFKDQEIIQFKIEYRYSSKDGQENQTEGYTITSDSGVTDTGYFSNWTRVMSNIRDREYDNDLGAWVWVDEDITNADKPNITQLDISIQEYEKVDIRVKSISEAGYPDVTFESDWSDVLTIKFPDELVNSITSNQAIVDEATEDNLKIQFTETLNTKGITKHVSTSFTNGDQYVAHLDTDIQTSYKDDSGNAFTLNEYLQYLINKIETLENIVYASKGKLRVLFYNGVSEIQVNNGEKLTIDYVCEKYGTLTSSGVYKNQIYLHSDYYIKLENISTSPLSFLVNEKYNVGTKFRVNNNDLPSLVDSDNNLLVQENNQFIYFCDKADGVNLYQGNTLQSAAGGVTDPINNAIISSKYNVGLNNSFLNTTNSNNLSRDAYSAYGKGSDWNIGDKLGSMVCPRVKNIKDLIVENYIGENFKTLNGNSSLKIPINIYWKFQTNNSENITLSNLSSEIHTKSLKVLFNPSSIDSDYEFTLTFNIKNKK